MRGAKTRQNTTQSRSIHNVFLLGLGILALNSPTALAREPDAKNNLPIKANPTATVSAACNMADKSKFDAMIYATCYSEQKQAISILVRGNAEGMSGQKIADYLVSEFGKSHVPSVSFLGETDRIGVSIVFFLNGDYYGPYSGENWRKGMQTLIVHSAQAWHK